MASGRRFKFLGIIAISIVAVISGLAVGKIFVNMSSVAQSISGTYVDYQDKAADVEALYQRSRNGASVLSFNAVELFEIAEYRLYNNNYHSVMVGTVNTVMNQAQSTEALWRDGKLVYNKLSPGGVTLGIDTNVHNQIIYDSAEGVVSVNKKGTFTLEKTYKETSKIKDSEFVAMKANFDESGAVRYSVEEYEKAYLRKPYMTIPYIISSITCGQGNFDTKAKSNGDGTYTFNINISGDYLYAAALYYSKDIEDGSGSAPIWQSLKISVTIDSNFRFKQIVYDEIYKVQKVGMLVSIEDDFMQRFEYENLPSIEEVL